MLELLGNGDIPDGMNPKLLEIFEKLENTNPAEAIRMEQGLRELYNLVKNDRILKNSEYID